MEQVLSALLEISVYATALILAILLFRALFYSKISPKLQYLLWGLLILRLMLPVTIESGFHVASLFPAPAAAASQAVAPAIATPANAVRSEAPSAAANSPAPAAVVPRTAIPVQKPVSWVTVAFCVWISGVALSLAFTAYARIRFARRLRQSALPSSEAATLLFSGCLASQGVSGKLLLLTTRMPISPSLTILSGKSVLILPEQLTDTTALRYAILHEVTHFRRRDHWMLLLLSVLRAVYWFNPFLWFAYSEMRADMETACDARVLSLLEPTEKKCYLTTLLRLFTSELQPSLGMAQVQTRRMAKKRMKGAFMKQTTSKPVILTAVIFSLLLVALCFTTACQPAPEQASFAPIPTATSSGAEQPALSAGGGDDFSILSGAGKDVFFTCRDGGTDEYSFTKEPRDAAAVVSPKDAACAAAGQLVRVFGEQISGGELCVAFRNTEDLRLELYSVFLGGDTYESASYYGLVDAATGDVLSVENLKIANASQETSDFIDYQDPVWENAGDETFAFAKQFITEHFPSQGAILDDSYYDGIQQTFMTEDPICVDEYIHMEQGPSYSMRIRYPSMTVENVCAYPLGWDYCMAQTWYYEYMHPEEARSEYSALTSDELGTVAAYAASLVGQAYESTGAESRYQNSLLFVQDVWAHFGAAEKTRQTAKITSADQMTYPAGTQLELLTDDPANQLEGFYLGNNGYVYADSETGKVEQGDFQKDFGKKFTACMVTTAVFVPRAGEYAVSIGSDSPVPTPTTAPRTVSLELTPGDYVVISEEAKAMVGRNMTEPLDITKQGDAWYSGAFVRYIFKRVHVAVEGMEAMDFDSVSDPVLIAGRQVEFMDDSDPLCGIYVGDGKVVLLNLATNIVEALSLKDMLNNSAYSNFKVDILYAPSLY